MDRTWQVAERTSRGTKASDENGWDRASYRNQDDNLGIMCADVSLAADLMSEKDGGGF